MKNCKHVKYILLNLWLWICILIEKVSLNSITWFESWWHYFLDYFITINFCCNYVNSFIITKIQRHFVVDMGGTLSDSVFWNIGTVGMQMFPVLVMSAYLWEIIIIYDYKIYTKNFQPWYTKTCSAVCVGNILALSHLRPMWRLNVILM